MSFNPQVNNNNYGFRNSYEGHPSTDNSGGYGEQGGGGLVSLFKRFLGVVTGQQPSSQPIMHRRQVVAYTQPAKPKKPEPIAEIEPEQERSVTEEVEEILKTFELPPHGSDDPWAVYRKLRESCMDPSRASEFETLQVNAMFLGTGSENGRAEFKAKMTGVYTVIEKLETNPEDFDCGKFPLDTLIVILMLSDDKVLLSRVAQLLKDKAQVPIEVEMELTGYRTKNVFISSNQFQRILQNSTWTPEELRQLMAHVAPYELLGTTYSPDFGVDAKSYYSAIAQVLRSYSKFEISQMLLHAEHLRMGIGSCVYREDRRQVFATRIAIVADGDQELINRICEPSVLEGSAHVMRIKAAELQAMIRREVKRQAQAKALWQALGRDDYPRTENYNDSTWFPTLLGYGTNAQLIEEAMVLTDKELVIHACGFNLLIKNRKRFAGYEATLREELRRQLLSTDLLADRISAVSEEEFSALLEMFRGNRDALEQLGRKELVRGENAYQTKARTKAVEEGRRVLYSANPANW